MKPVATVLVLLLLNLSLIACNPHDSIPKSAQNPETPNQGDVNYFPRQTWNPPESWYAGGQPPVAEPSHSPKRPS